MFYYLNIQLSIFTNLFINESVHKVSEDTLSFTLILNSLLGDCPKKDFGSFLKYFAYFLDVDLLVPVCNTMYPTITYWKNA